MNAWRFHKPRGYRRAAAREQARSHDERASGFWHLSDVGLLAEVRVGSWLCENAKTLNHDRRSCSSKTVLVAQRASGFNLVIELKNIILRRASIFEFSHSQGHFQTWARAVARSALLSRTDVASRASQVRKVPGRDIACEKHGRLLYA
jgi:hypothetical protein